MFNAFRKKYDRATPEHPLWRIQPHGLGDDSQRIGKALQIVPSGIAAAEKELNGLGRFAYQARWIAEKRLESRAAQK